MYACCWLYFFFRTSCNLCLCQCAPHLWIFNPLSIFVCTLKVFNVVDQYGDGLHVVLKLSENLESLFVQLRAHGDFSYCGAVKLVQAVNVVHDPGFVCLDSSQDEEVLEVWISRKGRALKHNLLQQLDQFGWEISGHKGFDGDANLRAGMQDARQVWLPCQDY